MDDSVRQRLLQLREDSLKSQTSEIQIWFRETLEKNIIKLLEEDASHAQVKNCIIGGFRALYDSGNLPEDDPMLKTMEAFSQRL